MRVKLFVAAAMFAVMFLMFAVGEGVASRGRAVLVVDRDGVQCGNADFTSIQAAVDAAQPGDLVRVCPDLYTEAVVVDKPLTLKADPDAIEALDCFQPTLPELPTNQYAIVDPAGPGFSIAFNLDADDVNLAGFVVQGAYVGIDASDSFSGYRLHHNLIRLNKLFGIDFGSEGTGKSRVDHNCIRDALQSDWAGLLSWGLVSELDDDSLWAFPVVGNEREAWNARDLINARIDHNSTFRNAAGLEAGGPGRHDRVSFDHNASRDDQIALGVQNSDQARIVNNEVSPTIRGMSIGGANTGLEITGNLVETGRQGIGFVPPTFYIDVFPAPTLGAVVAENVVTGQVLDGIVAAADRLHQSLLLSNVTSDNLRDGIILRLNNRGNHLLGNVAERNAEYGIYAQGAVANMFEANQMLSNGVFDGRDENRAANTWIANQCVTDYPTGSICGVG